MDGGVADVVQEFEALPGCSGVRVQMAGPVCGDGAVELFISASIKRADDGVYVKPHRTVRVAGSEWIAGVIRFTVGLEGPGSFLQAECSRRTEALVSAGADLSSYEQRLLPLLLPPMLRTEPPGPRRQDVIRALRDDRLPYRPPRQKALFTDMRPDELWRVVTEAACLAHAAQTHPDELLPLFPAEADRIHRPPAAGRRPRDCESVWQELKWHPGLLRKHAILGRDLVMLRLGHDPDNRQSRTSLRVALHRVHPVGSFRQTREKPERSGIA
jgi:hypothetical protein